VPEKISLNRERRPACSFRDGKNGFEEGKKEKEAASEGGTKMKKRIIKIERMVAPIFRDHPSLPKGQP